jgi:hypothetical protein
MRESFESDISAADSQVIALCIATGPEMRPYISWMLVHRRVPGKDVFRNKAHARKVGSTYDPQLTTIHEVLVEEYLWPKLDFAR